MKTFQQVESVKKIIFKCLFLRRVDVTVAMDTLLMEEELGIRVSLPTTVAVVLPAPTSKNM